MAKTAYYEEKASHMIMFQDISGRKRIEQAFLEEEEKCHNLFDSSPDAIGIVDEENPYLSVNLAKAESFGPSQE